MTDPADTKLTGAEASTKLAADRTRLAYERTMMAWLRTSTSLISFGFTIQKFFQIENAGNSQYDGLLGPSNLGRLMILAGLVTLVLATLEHRRDLNALKKDYPFTSAFLGQGERSGDRSSRNTRNDLGHDAALICWSMEFDNAMSYKDKKRSFQVRIWIVPLLYAAAAFTVGLSFPRIEAPPARSELL
jgi:putative membrane protein